MNAATVPLAREMFPGEPTVSMSLPQPVTLTLSSDIRNPRSVHFEAGTQEVPQSLADHWYLKARGATLIKGAK
jgi:hypothetical protein